MTSAARIPKLEPAALDEDQRALYDAIAGGRRAQGPQLFRLADSEGRLEGPFNAFLLQPRLGSALQALGSAVRYDTGLDDRCREIAILIVAAHWESEFEWYAHEAVGRSVGLGDAELAAVRDGRYTELTAARDGRPAALAAARDGRPAALAGREAVVARTTAALVARGDLERRRVPRSRRPPRHTRPVRAAHPGRLLRHPGPPAPRLPRPRPRRRRAPSRHRDATGHRANEVNPGFHRARTR